MVAAILGGGFSCTESNGFSNSYGQIIHLKVKVHLFLLFVMFLCAKFVLSSTLTAAMLPIGSPRAFISIAQL
jgi:hypothetical protein